VRPAFSIILFTTASGAGYGLLALIGRVASDLKRRGAKARIAVRQGEVGG